MTTRRGFLGGASDAPPRMTAGQKADVLAGGRAAFFAGLPPATAAAMTAILAESLEGVPDDRSCASCDFSGTEDGAVIWCSRWQAAPPEEVAPKGCDEFQDFGAPF